MSGLSDDLAARVEAEALDLAIVSAPVGPLGKLRVIQYAREPMQIFAGDLGERMKCLAFTAQNNERVLSLITHRDNDRTAILQAMIDITGASVGQVGWRHSGPRCSGFKLSRSRKA